MTLDGRDGRRGIGALLRDLAEGSATLVRDEVKLAKIEIGDAVAGIGRGTVFVAGGAVFALIGTLSVIAGIVLLVGISGCPRIGIGSRRSSSC